MWAKLFYILLVYSGMRLTSVKVIYRFMPGLVPLRYRLNRPIWKLMSRKDIPPDVLVHIFLRNQFFYYQKLSPKQQFLFRTRVREFIAHKEFLGRNGLIMTSEIKTLISAAAIQLSFGLDNFIFPHFKTIIVYPGYFISPNTKAKTLGEVNPKGIIVLSLKHFIEGYLNHNNAFNLGLHEMAHALKLENAIPNSEYGFLKSGHLDKWLDASSIEIRRIRKKESNFLRDYSARNSMEFFAVSVEYFFEKPVEFKETLPELYGLLCRLLNQDTAKLYSAE